MDKARRDDLVCRYCDRSIREHEAHELIALLEESADGINDFAEQVTIERILVEAAKPTLKAEPIINALPAERDRKLASRVMMRINEPRAQRPRKRAAGGSAWPIAAAAALLIGVAIYFLYPGEKAGNIVAHIESAAPKTMLSRDGNTTAAKAGGEIHSGEKLSVSSDGTANVAYSDGTHLAVDSDATLVFDDEKQHGSRPNAGKIVTIEKGSLSADVTHQPENRAMTFVTRQADAVVVGTKLRLSVDPEATRLEVSEGTVTLARVSDSKTVSVSAGNYCVASKDAEFAAKPITPPPPAPVLADATAALPNGATVLFRCGFEKGETGDWIGDLTTPPVSGNHAVAMQGHAIRESYDKAHFFAEVRSARSAQGWRVGKHTYLRFRYLLDKFSPKHYLKVMFKRGSDEMNYAGYLTDLTGGKWQTVTLRLDDNVFYVDDPSRKLPEGETISRLIWEGFSNDAPPAGARFWIEDVLLFEHNQDLPDAISMKSKYD